MSNWIQSGDGDTIRAKTEREMSDIVERLRDHGHVMGGPERTRIADEIDRMRAALKFYASPDTHKQVHIPSRGFSVSDCIIDNGQRAREALSPQQGEAPAE